LHRNAAKKVFTKDDICLAEKADVTAWMNLRAGDRRIPGHGMKQTIECDTKSIDEKRDLVLKGWTNILVRSLMASPINPAVLIFWDIKPTN